MENGRIRTAPKKCTTSAWKQPLLQPPPQQQQPQQPRQQQQQPQPPLLPQQPQQQLQQPQLHVQIYGVHQNAKRKRRLVNAILHALLMIASRPKQNVERNARFARPNMNHFTL